MSDLLESNQLEDFAIYSEKHHLFDSFTDAVSKLVIAKPVDPFGFLIDYFTKSTSKLIDNHSKIHYFVNSTLHFTGFYSN
jgi:hypothetical protein